MAQGRLKKQPQRTCIACRRVSTKRDLIRVVRTPNGGIIIDPTGKAAGRGAYLCRRRSCWVKALEQGRLGPALKVELTPADRALLMAYAAQLPETEPQAEEGPAAP